MTTTRPWWGAECDPNEGYSGTDHEIPEAVMLEEYPVLSLGPYLPPAISLVTLSSLSR